MSSYIDLTGLPESNITWALGEMERRYPELWKVCYPRHYNEPSKCGSYYSPKYVSYQLLQLALKIARGFVGQSEMYEFLAMSHMAKYGVPVYWLGKDMTTAVQQTMPPGEFDWYEMPMPFPACAFMLPKGALVHPTEGDVVFVMYARMRAGEHHVSKLVPGKEYCYENGGMTLFAYTVGGLLTHWNIPLDHYGSVLSIPDLERLMDMYIKNVHTSGFWAFSQAVMTPADDRLGVQVMHLIFGTLFLMNNRPDLVTTGRMLKRVKAKAGATFKEFWSPNIIGENYKIRREPAHLGGTHASPRFHWVKGSWKGQPYGEGRKLRKTIWIEPYTRGA